MAEEVILKLKTDLEGALKDLEGIKSQLEGVDETTKKTAKNLPSLTKGFKKVGASIGTLVKASGVFIVIQKAVEFFTEALSKNQEIANTVSIVFDTISSVLNKVVGVLVDVYKNVSQSTENFDALGKVMGGIVTIVIAPFKAGFLAISRAIYEAQLAWEQSAFGSGDQDTIDRLTKKIEENSDGFKELGNSVKDAGADIVNNFSEAVKEATNIKDQVVAGVKEIDIEQEIADAKNRKRLENQTQIAKAQIQGLIEENDRLAEKQRQLRDDENATFDDRLLANQKLGEILDKQEKEMLALADIAIASAQADLAQLDNIENRVKLQEALNEKKAIEAQIEGFRSEQLTNQVSLENELRDTKEELALIGISARKREMLEIEQEFEERVRLAEKAGEDITTIEEERLLRMQELKQEHFQQDLQIASDLASAMTDITAQREANELQEIDIKFKSRLAMAEGDAEETARLEAEKEKQVNATKRKFAGKKKAGATAEAVINTFQAASKSLADYGFPVGAIFAALAITQGMLQVQAIQNTPVGYAQGGLVGGYGTGTSDSVDARLSKGETVINARSTRMFKPILSKINEAGGGRKFADGGTLDEGGAVGTLGLVKAYVVTDEVNDSQNQLEKIRTTATI